MSLLVVWLFKVHSKLISIFKSVLKSIWTVMFLLHEIKLVDAFDNNDVTDWDEEDDVVAIRESDAAEHDDEEDVSILVLLASLSTSLIKLTLSFFDKHELSLENIVDESKEAIDDEKASSEALAIFNLIKYSL